MTPQNPKQSEPGRGQEGRRPQDRAQRPGSQREPEKETEPKLPRYGDREPDDPRRLSVEADQSAQEGKRGSPQRGTSQSPQVEGQDDRGQTEEE